MIHGDTWINLNVGKRMNLNKIISVDEQYLKLFNSVPKLNC